MKADIASVVKAGVARLAKVANNKFKKYGLLNKLYFFGSVGSGYFCYEKCI